MSKLDVVLLAYNPCTQEFKIAFNYIENLKQSWLQEVVSKKIDKQNHQQQYKRKTKEDWTNGLINMARMRT